MIHETTRNFTNKNQFVFVPVILDPNRFTQDRGL